MDRRSQVCPFWTKNMKLGNLIDIWRYNLLKMLIDRTVIYDRKMKGVSPPKNRLIFKYITIESD